MPLTLRYKIAQPDVIFPYTLINIHYIENGVK